jgi:hypothetical protein
MSSPLNARYHRDRTIRAGRSKLAGWSPRDIAKLAGREPVRSTNPTVDEMRRVAVYLGEVMGLHSAAGKLLARVDQLIKARQE